MTRLIEVIEDGVSLAALEENAHDGCVETVLFDAARAGCGGSQQQIAPRRCEVVLIQGGLRKNQIAGVDGISIIRRSEEHTSELQSRSDLVCRLLLEKKNKE